MSRRKQINPACMWAVSLIFLILTSCTSELKITPTGTQAIWNPVPTLTAKVETPTFTKPPATVPSKTNEIATSTPFPMRGLPSRIAYLSSQGIGILDQENRQTQLVECNYFCYTPVWSPDGKSIAFSASFEYGETLQVYDVNITTGSIKRITTPPKDKWGLSWSPDGKYLVYTEEGDPTDLVIISSDGKDSKKITYTPGYEGFPAWSPDGENIAFLYRDERFTENSEIWLMNRDGKSRERVTDFPVSTHNTVTWSPDGRSLGFISDVEDDSGNQCGELYKINIVEKEVINLSKLSNFPGCIENPAWSPGGEYIMFIGSDSKITPIPFQDSWEIYIMRSDGSDWWRATKFYWRPLIAIWDPEEK